MENQPGDLILKSLLGLLGNPNPQRMPNFCKECTHWEEVVKDSATSKGICSNTGVAINVSLDGTDSINTSVVLWTNPYFGCIYWKEKDKSLRDFDEDGKPKGDH